MSGCLIWLQGPIRNLDHLEKGCKIEFDEVVFGLCAVIFFFLCFPPKPDLQEGCMLLLQGLSSGCFPCACVDAPKLTLIQEQAFSVYIYF